MSDVETWAVRGAVGAVVAALTGLFLRVRTNESRLAVAEKTLARAESTESEVSEIRVSLATISERLDHLPSQGDLQRLHDRISRNGDVGQETARKVAAMAESISGLRGAVDRLHALELAREKQ